MYGVDTLEHDERYARSAEFIDVLRGAWDAPRFSYEGRFYRADELELEPRPSGPLTVFQGGQSNDAIAMAAARSDWMFLNGGTPERIESVIGRVRDACLATGRTVRFAPLRPPRWSGARTPRRGRRSTPASRPSTGAWRNAGAPPPVGPRACGPPTRT